MKQTIGLISLFIIIILSYPEGITGNSSGSPGGKTNSPTDGNNCTGCHSGNINSGPGNISISSNIPSTGYIPGETYTITTNITENGSNKFGFEITSEGGSGVNPKIGEWIITDGNSTKKVNNDAAVTHKSSGNSGSNNMSWSVDWKAPLWGMSTGMINFYAAGVAANNNGNNTGDNVYTTEYIVNEQQPSSLENNTNTFNIFYSNNKINISCEIELKKLMIHTINGKLIYKYDKKIPSQIDVQDLEKGMYIINSIDNYKNIYSKKVNIY